MVSLAAALAVSLALGTGEARARASGGDASWDAKNAARAKLGLLPRKPPRKARPMLRNGTRIVPSSAPAPTFLGEPGTVAGAPAHSQATRDARPLRLAAHGVVTDVTLSMHFER